MRTFMTALILIANIAWAADVYLNGTNVTGGLTNQSFKDVNVHIDGKGNVRIEAPEYSVKRLNVAPPKGQLTMRYYLVSEHTPLGSTEYDIEVYINDKYLRTVGSTEGPIVEDITKNIEPGENKVTMRAKKRRNVTGARKSSSASDVFRILIGEGKANKEKVLLEKTIVSFSVTAATTQEVMKKYSFTTR